MSTQKRKFELFARLQELGFTYEEAVSLRRIEMTLQRWGEAECNGDVCRDESTGKAYRQYGSGNGPFQTVIIADREAGALKRLKAIVFARNNREWALNETDANHVFAYHQSDCRGCNLYLLKSSQLPVVTDAEIERHSGKHAVANAAAKMEWKLSTYYTRGLAVCA